MKNSRFSNSILIILAACGNHSNHEHHSHEGKLKVVTTNLFSMTWLNVSVEIRSMFIASFQ